MGGSAVEAKIDAVPQVYDDRLAVDRIVYDISGRTKNTFASGIMSPLGNDATSCARRELDPPDQQAQQPAIRPHPETGRRTRMTDIET